MDWLTHEEDVWFDFRGSNPHDLEPGRFYKGSVDGFADFGVFVDLSPQVTGLLHRSELDRRLESLDWDAGDEVFVQVKNVRDNGDVDLAWSIRQSASEFRGARIHNPGGDDDGDPIETDDNDRPEPVRQRPATSSRRNVAQSSSSSSDSDSAESARPDEAGDEETGDEAADEAARPDEPDADAQSDEQAAGDLQAAAVESADGPDETTETTETDAEAVSDPDPESEPEQAGEGAEAADTGDESDFDFDEVDDAETDAVGTDASADAGSVADEEAAEAPERVTVDALSDAVGEDVRLEGEVVSARQTGGPTIFEVRDETGVVDCAAFVEAGVRAYPDVDVGDVVRIDGEVELRRDELQVETEELTILEGTAAEAVTDRLRQALTDRARPAEAEPLAPHGPVEAVAASLRDAAEAIRRAVFESRPVVVRHAATADGYVAGAAIERAVLPLVREEHAQSDAEYHYFTRRPLDDAVYGMDAATNDVTRMLQDRDRHDEKIPLVVLVATGSTEASLDGLGLLGVYDAERVVVDAAPADEGIAPEVDVLVNPAHEGIDASALSTGALGANLAAVVGDGDEQLRADLAHLPAVSYWEAPPKPYQRLAANAGYDVERCRQLREAVALEAYYQSYEDKRELIADLLFEGPAPEEGGLAGHVASQFRVKLDDELETARANLEVDDRDGVRVAVLDADAFTHRFDFPPTTLLLDELHRQVREEDDRPLVTVGLGMDELYVRSTDDVDVREVAAAAREAEPEAGVTAVGVREGRVEFLSGARDRVRDAVVDSVANQLA
jgi:RecJ-like exonuclease